MDTVDIYVLKLVDGCYYIGKSEDVTKRFKDHLNGTGSAWTKLHPPIELEKVIPKSSPFEEDRLTKEYMSVHGIDRVRGGSYVRVKLSKATVEALQKEIRMAQDLCVRCGKPGHFVSQCRFVADVNGESLKKKEVKKKLCTRCNRTNHTSERCYAKTDANGAPLEPRVQEEVKEEVKLCTKCGRANHTFETCYAKIDVNGASLEPKVTTSSPSSNDEGCVVM